LILSADILGEDEEWISLGMFSLFAFALLLVGSVIVRSFFFSAVASLSATEKMGHAWNYLVELTISFRPLHTI
jgi:cytochrome c biogenesis factor